MKSKENIENAKYPAHLFQLRSKNSKVVEFDHFRMLCVVTYRAKLLLLLAINKTMAI